MLSKTQTRFLVIAMLCTILIPLANTGYAQTPTTFSTKGAVSESSTFHGVMMWTIIKDNKGTIILQSPVGRGLVHVSITPSTNCDSSMPICLFSTVVDSTDTNVFKTGDTARISANLDSKQELISMLTGVLAGFDASVNLSKTWTSHPANTTIANPASVYCVNNGGKLDIRTTPQGQTGMCVFPNGSECDEWSYYRGECSSTHTGTNSTNSTAKHFEIGLNESIGIKAKS